MSRLSLRNSRKSCREPMVAGKATVSRQGPLKFAKKQKLQREAGRMEPGHKQRPFGLRKRKRTRISKLGNLSKNSSSVIRQRAPYREEQGKSRPTYSSAARDAAISSTGEESISSWWTAIPHRAMKLLLHRKKEAYIA